MTKTGWIVAILAIIVIAGGAYWYTNKSAETMDTDDTTTATTTTATTTTDTGIGEAPATDTTTGTSAGTYTAAQVATHKDATSCWSIIDGNVYDLTKWIPQHPGGERAILGLCGKDGTAAFHGQHDDAKKQADILATMKIGVVTK